MIIVEDGTNVPNANSYVSVVNTRAYSARFAVDLPTDDLQVENFLFQAMRWIETQSWIGERAHVDQELTWPRLIDNVIVLDKKIIEAQNYLVTQLAQNVELLPPVTENAIFAQKVGQISITYASYDRMRNGPSFPYLDKLLNSLMRYVGFSATRV